MEGIYNVGVGAAGVGGHGGGGWVGLVRYSIRSNRFTRLLSVFDVVCCFL